MAKSILHTIERNMPTFSKGQKRIADYILQNYDKAAFMTASKLGKLSGVSESTVVRFASELGYDGYPSMQRALQEMIRSRLTSTQRIQAADNLFGGQDVLSAVIQSDMDKLRMVAEEADRTEFNKVVDLILGAGHLYILGVRTSSFVAGYLNFYLHLLSENVTLVQSNAAGEIFEQLLRIGPGDVMIAISFPRYSKVTMNTVKFAQDRGATIVAITDNELSPVYQMAEAALLAPSEMISFVDSMVAPLSLINALDDLLPQKLIPVAVERSGIPPHQKVHDLTREQRRELVQSLKHFSVEIAGPCPVTDAIVTSGGIKISEIDPKTMESKLVKGLYFSGEIMDVDAYTGGFNLQIAWATGRAAGQAAAEALRQGEENA